jgi:hypothetical protein
MNIFDEINEGKYSNALPYARKSDDLAAWEAYQQETTRLYRLFVDDLLAHLGLSAGPASDALLQYAWEKGHAHGFSEVAIEASVAADLLKAGATEERARIRRELLAKLDGEHGFPFDDFRERIDRACQELAE